MNTKHIFVALVVVGLAVAPGAGAATFLVGEKDVSTSGAVDDDLFIVGNGVMISDDVAQDVFAGGQAVTVQSQVGGDVFAGGNFVHVKGVVNDDVLVAGEKVEITAASVDDVFAGGNRVDISSNTVVNGSVFAAGQTVTIAGTVKGSVKMAGDNMVIKSGAVIEGDLLTYGEKEPIIEEGAQVLGKTTHKVREVKEVGRASIGRWVSSVVAWFVAGVLLIYLLPGFARRVTETAVKSSGKSIGLGLLWILLFFPALVLLMVTVVGIPIAIMLAFLTALSCMLAIVYATVTVGVWAINKISKSENMDIKWQHVLLGVVIYKLLGLVPLVGWLLVLAVTLLALGALLISLWQRFRTT